MCNCSQATVKKDWVFMATVKCTNVFSANASTELLPRTCCFVHKKHDKLKHGLEKEDSDAWSLLLWHNRTKLLSSNYNLKEKTPEDSDACVVLNVMSKFREVLKEIVNVTSTNRVFCTVQHAVAIYKQTKRDCCTFVPKKKLNQTAYCPLKK